MYEHEFNVFQFLQHPDVMIEQALTLRYKPVNLDVLPLFIVLMLASPFILWGLRAARTGACSAPSCCISSRTGSAGIFHPSRTASGISIPLTGN
jgi:hypothetical protein